MYIFVNSIICTDTADGNKVRERVLWIDEGNIICFVIDIDNALSFPNKRLVKEIIEDLNNGISCFDDDNWQVFPHEDLSEINKKKRDEAWTLIKDIVVKEPEIFLKEFRGAAVNSLKQQFGHSHNTINKHLRRYWQRGKTINSLIPDYHNSGGKGKEKNLGQKKAGRKRKYEEIVGEGTNVTPEIKRIFNIVYKKHYATLKENSITFVYRQMLREFFYTDIYYEDGVPKPILKDDDEIPSIIQFRYFCKKQKEKDYEFITRARKGKDYNLAHRALLSNSNIDASGSGAKFQIDSTIADIYLVSEFYPEWVIGRPVIYMVSDTISRMITGFYVGLEGPSWAGAMMALANVAENKVEFCKKYDTVIEESDWNNTCMPKIILADRAEFLGKKVETAIKNLGIVVENTPPYRADWKGIIESDFRTFHEKVKPLSPGAVHKDHMKRGGKDYRLDAIMNLRQFTKLMIKYVLFHNNQNWMTSYTRNEQMIINNVPPIPKNLWDWGLGNQTGSLNYFSEDIVKLNLLPTGVATVTRKGIKFNNMFYSCEKAIAERWFEKAYDASSWKVDISYDIRNMNFIYIRYPGGREYDKCFLLDWQQFYKDKSFEDILFKQDMEDFEYLKYKKRQEQSEINLDSEIEFIINNANKESQHKYDLLSANKKVKNINSKRKEEKEKMRETEAFNIGATAEKSLVCNEDEEAKEIKGSSLLDKLRKTQKEKLYGEDNSVS